MIASTICCMPSFSEVNSGRGGCLLSQLGHLLVSRQHGAAQAAVLFFHLDKARQHRTCAQLCGIAAVNAGQQRIGQAIDNLCPEMPLHQLRDGLVSCMGRGGCSSSRAMRILVPQENSGENAVGMSLVGTMNIRPSGITTSRPCTTM